MDLVRLADVEAAGAGTLTEDERARYHAIMAGAPPSGCI
jgi:hypothetical protein